MSQSIVDHGCRALLLAGGMGSRLRPITDTTPKCLVQIQGRPLLEYWFDALGDAGLREARVNTHHLPEPVRHFLREKREGGVFNVTESYESTLLGSAGTITANRDLADGVNEILIVYVDNLSSVNVAELIAFHRNHSDPFTMLLFRSEDPSACGIAELDEEQRVVSFEEKPNNPKSDLANAGVYVVSADAYREIADMNAFDIGFNVLPKFIGRMRGYGFDGYHRDIGTLESLEAAEREAPAVFADSESLE